MKVEFTMGEKAGRVVAGVDTHSESHWLCVLGERGDVLCSREFPATPDGYAALAAAIGEPGGCLAVGVEGTASYGAGLTRALMSAGYRVYEVLRPARARRRPGQRKCDAADAERAARDVLNCNANLSLPKPQDGWVEEVRFCLRARAALVKSRTALANTAHALLKTAPGGIRERYRGMPARTLMPALADAGDGAFLGALSELGATWVEMGGRATQLEAAMRSLLAANMPSLLAMQGCDAVTAAKIVVAIGDDPGRVGSEAKLAALFGTSPVVASSAGKGHHRMNRGGNREANSALHQVVVARAKCDPATIAFVDERLRRGKSKKEAYRMLQRYVAREVYQAITHPFGAPPWADVEGLAEARVRAGVTQGQLAAILGTSPAIISKVEGGKRRCKAVIAAYREWVSAGCPVEAVMS